MKLKRLAVLSNDSLIFDALADNFSQFVKNEVELYDNQNDIIDIRFRDGVNYYIQNIQVKNIEQIHAIKKIDLLILDAPLLKDIHAILARSNILANLTKESLHLESVSFCKPFCLIRLLDLVLKNKNDKNLFCSINEEWVYNEKKSHLLSATKVIDLTYQENKLFKSLLELKNYKVDKDYLKQTVWNYHKNAESGTVDTHLYRLKQKLPESLLEVKTSYCKLLINDLE